ncbi:MAG: hypothetical protein ACREMN_03165, partial [Gemmatimonadales bacterium]
MKTSVAEAAQMLDQTGFAHGAIVGSCSTLQVNGAAAVLVVGVMVAPNVTSNGGVNDTFSGPGNCTQASTACAIPS